MKTLFYTVIILWSIITSGQIEIPKAGIYKNFKEFKENNPSIAFFGTVRSHDSDYGNAWDKEVFTSYSLNITKEESKKIGEIFGFSDGNKFYIATYTHRIYDYPFYELEFIGKEFLYFESLNPAGYGVIKVTYILMTDSGEMRYLTNNRVKKILKSNPELYERFKAEENKFDSIKEYLIEYQRK